MILQKTKRKCRFCERPIEKGHRCYRPNEKVSDGLRDKPKQTSDVLQPANTGGNRNRKEELSEAALFTKLYHGRGSISEISGKPLLPIGHPQWHWQFLHVLPKGLYKRYRLNSRNIVLALPEEHTYQDKATKDPKWSWFFLLKDFLKQEYNASKNVQ